MNKFEYPMWFKYRKDGSVFKFLSIDVAVCVVDNGTCEDSYFEVGQAYAHMVEHTFDKTWENVTHLYQETVSDEKTSIPPLELCGTQLKETKIKHLGIPYSVEEKGHNNGGSTDYYKLKTDWKDCADIMEDRAMNYNQGNIFKSAFCFNVGRHNGTDYERELNKIIYFAERELKRIKNVECN